MPNQVAQRLNQVAMAHRSSANYMSEYVMLQYDTSLKAA